MKTKKESEITANEIWCAALSYSYIGLLWFLFDKDIRKKQFVKFHVKQSILLLFLLLIFEMMMGLMPFLSIIWLIFILLIFLLSIIGFFYSIEAKRKQIPFIGQYSNNIRI